MRARRRGIAKALVLDGTGRYRVLQAGSSQVRQMSPATVSARGRADRTGRGLNGVGGGSTAMRRMRLSIAGLLGIVLVAAVGLALLRVADAFWAGVAYACAVVAILVAVLGAMFAVGELRAMCAGFAVFC